VSTLPISLRTLLGICSLSLGAYAQARGYVANFGSNSISVIDTSSNTVVSTVPVGSQPNGVAVTPDGTRAYVANGGGDVWVISTSNNTVLAKVVVGEYPTAVAITPDGTRAYVTRANGNSVSVIATSSNTVTATISVGTAPGGIAITPDGKSAYVTNVGTGSGPVSVIDTSSNTVTATVDLGNVAPVGVAVTPDGTRIYVLDGYGNLSVIGTSSNTVVGTVSLAGNEISPFGLAITPDGTRAYVTRFAANSIAVIDTSSNTVVGTVSLGAFPNGVAVTPDGKYAYVGTSIDATGNGNGTVSVIDTSSNTAVAMVGVGSTPYGLAFAPGGGAPSSPTILAGGIVNAASYAQVNGAGSPVAPGSLVAIFTSALSAQAAYFSTATLPSALGEVSVTFNNVTAPMVAVSPTGQYPYVSAQVPFGVLAAGKTSGTVPVVITVNNTPSPAIQESIVASQPGIFTIPATGQGNAILTFVNPGTNQPAIAAPPNSGISYPTAPIPRGTGGFFYATGLGAMTPAVPDGSGTCPAANGICNANATPTVTVGGITAPVIFAGQAPGFPGVFQVNITIPQNAPTGGNVSLVVKSADGSVTSNTATIAVQ